MPSVNCRPFARVSECVDKLIFRGIKVVIIKIRRPWDRPIFIMGIPILVRRYLRIKTATSIPLLTDHDDVFKWKHFPRHWPFVWEIHRLPVNSPHKDQWRGDLVFSLICALNKRLSKQSWGWWFETPTRSLWRHCNVTCWNIAYWKSVFVFWWSCNEVYTCGRPIGNKMFCCKSVGIQIHHALHMTRWNRTFNELK